MTIKVNLYNYGANEDMFTNAKNEFMTILHKVEKWVEENPPNYPVMERVPLRVNLFYDKIRQGDGYSIRKMESGPNGFYQPAHNLIKIYYANNIDVFRFVAAHEIAHALCCQTVDYYRTQKKRGDKNITENYADKCAEQVTEITRSMYLMTCKLEESIARLEKGEQHV